MNILFGKVNLPVLDKIKATNEIITIADSQWFWDSYRNSRMLPLMTKGGTTGREGAINYNKSNTIAYEWVSYTPDVVRDWFDNIVFPWMGMKTRIMVLMTQPGAENYEHIDCAPYKMGTLQHKFRIVIHGNTDTLYFKTSGGDVYAPNIEDSFIMDGSWPHGMKNNTSEFKITLCAGAPWEGNKQYDNVETLMDKQSYSMPLDFNKYFDKTLYGEEYASIR